MKYLKLVQPGFENFTGDFGVIPFKDGVSLEPVPRLLADRISSSLLVVELDTPDGAPADDAQAGAASRLVTGNLLSITLKASELVTPEQVAEEQAHLAEAVKKAKVPDSVQFYEVAELEEIASKKGMDGLREVAKHWNVKDRSINGLIREILKAQDANKQANANVERLVAETKAISTGAAIAQVVAEVTAAGDAAPAVVENDAPAVVENDAPVTEASATDASAE